MTHAELHKRLCILLVAISVFGLLVAIFGRPTVTEQSCSCVSINAPIGGYPSPSAEP